VRLRQEAEGKEYPLEVRFEIGGLPAVFLRNDITGREEPSPMAGRAPCELIRCPRGRPDSRRGDWEVDVIAADDDDVVIAAITTAGLLVGVRPLAPMSSRRPARTIG